MKTKDLDLSFLLSPHYSIKNCPDFLDNKFRLSLTLDSQYQFEIGKPGQGYVGIVDLQTRKIHLLPSFNKDDGLPRNRQNYWPFERYVESRAKLGKLSGDLHLNAAKMLGLEDKKSYLLGFGLWKAGYSVKFVKELPKMFGRIPYEFYFIKNNDHFELFFVGETRDEVYCQLPQLEAFFKTCGSFLIPDNGLLEDDKMAIEIIIRKHFRSLEDFTQSTAFTDLNHQNVPIKASYDFMNVEKQKIKYTKNRSTSQNALSVKYSKEYSLWFLARNRGHTLHANDLIRELPYEVFTKIMDTVASALRSVLTEGPIMARGVDGFADHVVLEHFWANYKAQTLLEFGFISCNQKLINTALYLGAGISKVAPILKEHSHPELCDALVDFAMDLQRKNIVHLLVHYAKRNMIDTLTLLGHLKGKIQHNLFPNYQELMARFVTELEACRDQYKALEKKPENENRLQETPEIGYTLSTFTKNEVFLFLQDCIQGNKIQQFISAIKGEPLSVQQELFAYLKKENALIYLLDNALFQLREPSGKEVRKFCDYFTQLFTNNTPDEESLVNIINLIGYTSGLVLKNGLIIEPNNDLGILDFHMVELDVEQYLQIAETHRKAGGPALECACLMEDIAKAQVLQSLMPACSFFPTLKEERTSKANTRPEDFHCHYPI